MKGNPVTLIGKEIKIGDKAPNFKVIDNDMKVVSFDEFRDKIVLISVVPSLDTGVCEFQTISFNERASEIDDIVILTISVDLPFAQKRFCVGKGIDKVKVYSDHRDLSFGKEYGFVIDELRLLARGIVLIDKDGTVKYVEYVNEVTDHPDYDRAIEEAKKLV